MKTLICILLLAISSIAQEKAVAINPCDLLRMPERFAPGDTLNVMSLRVVDVDGFSMDLGYVQMVVVVDSASLTLQRLENGDAFYLWNFPVPVRPPYDRQSEGACAERLYCRSLSTKIWK